MIIKANSDKMHLLAKYLLRYEKIDGENFEKLMRGDITEADIENDVFTENAPAPETESSTEADE